VDSCVCTSLQAGDCVVAFSRRDIFDIKTEIERLTTMRCCVVYGALPPETRRMQVSEYVRITIHTIRRTTHSSAPPNSFRTGREKNRLSRTGVRTSNPCLCEAELR